MTVLHVVGGAHVDALVAAWVAAGPVVRRPMVDPDHAGGCRGLDGLRGHRMPDPRRAHQGPGRVALLLWLAWLVAAAEPAGRLGPSRPRRRGDRAGRRPVRAAVGWVADARPLAGLSDLLGWASGPGWSAGWPRRSATRWACIARPGLVVVVNAAFLGLLALLLWRVLRDLVDGGGG